VALMPMRSAVRLIRMAISPLLAMSTELSAAVLGMDEDAGDAVERNRGTGLRERRLARRERMATELLQDLGVGSNSIWRRKKDRKRKEVARPRESIN
jgi:hypothetical protein